MGAQWWHQRAVDRRRATTIATWFLEVLRTSEREPDVPHEQSLEFYAHEFFSGDAEAIEEFIRMGRNESGADAPRLSLRRLSTEMLTIVTEDGRVRRSSGGADDQGVPRAEGRPHAGIDFAED